MKSDSAGVQCSYHPQTYSAKVSRSKIQQRSLSQEKHGSEFLFYLNVGTCKCTFEKITSLLFPVLSPAHYLKPLLLVEICLFEDSLYVCLVSIIFFATN